MDSKEKFLALYDEKIQREGAIALRDYLVKSDFFTAPASAKFHAAHEGGLAEHSVNVYGRLVKILQSEYGDGWTERYSEETAAVCGLLHDVCKIEYYRHDVKNVKVDGVWTQKPYYAYDEKLPYGHGEKSVYILNGFIRLTREEALAVNWHMGAFDYRVQGGGSNMLGDAFSKFRLSLFLHVADLEASYLDEEREG